MESEATRPRVSPEGLWLSNWKVQGCLRFGFVQPRRQPTLVPAASSRASRFHCRMEAAIMNTTQAQ